MTILYIDSTRFMASSLSRLADNFAEGIHEIKCNMDMIIKNVNCVKLNTKIVSAALMTHTRKMI